MSRSAVESIPFSLHPEVPLIAIDVLVNGKGPFKFVLDTGASLTMASPTLARRSGIRLENAQKARSLGIDGYQEVKIARIDRLQLGSTTVLDLEVGLSSMRPLNQGTPLKLQGILGYNFLRYFTVSIDYYSNQLCLSRNPRLRQTGGGSR